MLRGLTTGFARTCAILTALFATFSLPSFAYYTKSKEAPLFKGMYPTYPKTNSATGDKEALIKRGEYLAKTGDCIACHSDTANGKPAFAGGLAINTPFGTFHSPNITPDKATGIGKWTEDDFIHAMHDGKNPDGSNYFPVFPYVYFSNVSKDDLRALYTYLMNIPPVKLKNKPLEFPFSLPGARASLIGWNILFFYPNKGEYKYDPSQSSQWNRGKYIVNGLGHCSMCHTPLNVFGSPKQKYFLTGGFVDGFWAPNITEYGLKSASRFEVADVFGESKLINGAGTIAGPMAEVNHNSLRYLTEEDRLSIATYLKTVSSEEYVGVKGSDEPPSLNRGRQVYVNTCVICHQDGKMSAPVIGDSNGWFSRLEQQGLKSLYRHTIDGFNSMPVKGACVTCTKNDLISAVDYILHESLTRSQQEDLKAGKFKKKAARGQTIYQENCSLCHAPDTRGRAPKLGDKQVWRHVLRQNVDVIMLNVIDSNEHPKQGGCKYCSKIEVMNAVKYMLDKGTTGRNFNLW